ncbi:MAG: glycosyltransferase [Myxococcota bacterium]
MRLAIDIVGARHSGVAVVGMGVVEAAITHDSVDDVVVFASPRRDRRFELPLSRKLRVVECDTASSNTMARVAWNLGLSTIAAKRQGASAFLCLANGGVGASRVPLLLFIQQSLPFSAEALRALPTRARWRVAAIREVMRRSARRADLVGVQTEVMRNAVVQAFDVPDARVRVFQAPPPSFPPVDEMLLAQLRAPTRATLLYVGNTIAYKNLERLLDAFAGVRSTTNARLLLASPDAFSTTQPGVEVLKLSTRGQLRAAYEASDLLVFPSLVETVGLPLLEAMSLGVPILAADRPYAREICGDAADYFDPTDVASLRDSIARMLADPDLRSRKVSRAQRLLAERASASYSSLVAAATALAVKGDG